MAPYRFPEVPMSAVPATAILAALKHLDAASEANYDATQH
jgi:hypothetical protein